MRGKDGSQVFAENIDEGVALLTDPKRRALFNDVKVEHFGQLAPRSVRIEGLVQLLTRDRVRGGHLEDENFEITANLREVRGSSR